MSQLKDVSNRRTDSLTYVSWDQLEAMLAVYYRSKGYRVDHVGTGGSGTQFDGGIDLKLYKDDAYIVVQCKHWNAKQVTHNSLHELLGVMITQGATGAILVTSGEFSRFAIESASKAGNVQLVDGDALREMLGELPELESVVPDAGKRIQGGGRGQRRRGVIGHAMDAGLGIVLLKLVVGLIILLVMTNQIESIRRLLQPGAAQPAVVPVSGSVADADLLRSPRRAAPEVIDHFTGTVIEVRPTEIAAYRPPTAEEQRESKRQADEAIRILESSTPEM